MRSRSRCTSAPGASPTWSSPLTPVGGNVTGTARGLRAAGATDTVVVGASVDLSGLHMASDRDFNRKSFTTGHTGFSVPFTTWPDRADVPRSSARPLRYLDRFVTVTQGEVFYTTEALAQLEGMERGPAGNTSLAAALPLAAEMDADHVLVVQETEYTGAGKHPSAQLDLARRKGVRVERGDPPGEPPRRVDRHPRAPVPDPGRRRRPRRPARPLPAQRASTRWRPAPSSPRPTWPSSPRKPAGPTPASRRRSMRRPDDFEQRREHVRSLSNAELHERFWQLLDQVVAPLVGEARTHTSPAIERSVLLRMGLSSVEAKAVVVGWRPMACSVAAPAGSSSRARAARCRHPGRGRWAARRSLRGGVR